MLDLEQLGVTPQQAALIAPAWCQTVQNAQPDVRVLVYGNEWFIAAANLTPDELPNVGLIVASYGASPQVPPGWDHVCVWQYADNQPVPGFPAPVDINQVICPSNLDHLTIGDDVLNDADKAWIAQTVSDGVKAELGYLMGTRSLPKGIDPKTPSTIAAVLDSQSMVYRGIPGDPTHPGLIDVLTHLGNVQASVQEVQGRIANLANGGTVDPVFVAAVESLNNRLATMSWTLKAN
jgi:hypothetical protein